MKTTALIAAVALALASPALAQENPLQPSPTWDDLRESVIGLTTDPAIDDAGLTLSAPFRAHEAAIVPIHITQDAGTPALTGMTLVVDENPSPVAAVFTLGQAVIPLDFEIRARVNAYSDVRVVGTQTDGAKIMAGRFVKAAGGCSAPAGKNMADVEKTMGQMRWKTAAGNGEDKGRSIGTLMIRHPNFSGLQRDQVTLLTIPAHFIDRLEVRQGQDLLFTMEAGISISEDPVFRFAYIPNGQPVIVHAEDTDGNVWDQTFDAVSG